MADVEPEGPGRGACGGLVDLGCPFYRGAFVEFCAFALLYQPCPGDNIDTALLKALGEGPYSCPYGSAFGTFPQPLSDGGLSWTPGDNRDPLAGAPGALHLLPSTRASRASTNLAKSRVTRSALRRAVVAAGSSTCNGRAGTAAAMGSEEVSYTAAGSGACVVQTRNSDQIKSIPMHFLVYDANPQHDVRRTRSNPQVGSSCPIGP